MLERLVETLIPEYNTGDPIADDKDKFSLDASSAEAFVTTGKHQAAYLVNSGAKYDNETTTGLKVGDLASTL